MKPQFKPFVEYYFDKGKISFFVRPGTAIEVEDEDKFILTVCRLMDGKRDLNAIQNELMQDYPDDVSHIDELFELFDDEGLIQDNSVLNSGDLTEYDMERWSRNIEFFGAYCKAEENKFKHQELLKNTKVTLLGVGGVGSSVLLNLAALGVKNIRIVDFDKVELSNLNRQIIYNQADLGKLKAEVAKEKIQAFYPDAEIEVITSKIQSSKDIEALIQDSNIVVNAADHPRGEIIDWVNAACIAKSIPFLCGALDYRYAICYSVIPGQTGCIECWKSSARQANPIFQDYYKDEGFHAAEQLNVTIMPFISLVAGFITMDLLKMVTGIAQPVSIGSLQSFDFITGQVSEIESWGKDPSCDICSGL